MPHGAWATALDFLSERLPQVSRDEWRRRLLARQVLDGAGQAVSPETPLQAGQFLHYFRHIPDEAPIPFEEHIVFQDDWLVVADKPHFLPVTPAGRFVQQSLLVRLKRRLDIHTLSPIHRIDRETAGLTVFAVQPATRDAYHALFRERAVAKTYEAIAPSPGTQHFPRVHRSRIEEDPEAFFRMVEAPGEPNSESWIDVLEVRGDLARYALRPLSGRRHQLRVNMNTLGLPIVGDQFYPRVRRGPRDTEDFSEPLQLLARSLRFTDPVTGQARHFESRRTLAWGAGAHGGA
ncbi:MAG TPA: pseudouridine synthase [Burkholderiaceae bacterium]|nr:pseudouridine synthase [Burkholderiaceae bacterium]